MRSLGPDNMKHTLTCVAAAFRGPRPEGSVCRHRNDIGLDNRAGNVFWGTPEENRQDAVFNRESKAPVQRTRTDQAELEFLRWVRDGGLNELFEKLGQGVGDPDERHGGSS